MVLPKRLLVLGLAVALTGCVLNADAPLSSRAVEAVDLVPADAQMVAFADASSAMETIEAFGAMDDSGDYVRYWSKTREMLDEANLDPAEDVDFVVVYASDDQDPVFNAVGRFDVDAIGALLEREGGQPVDISGVRAWEMEGGGPVFALTEDGRRAIGADGVAALKAALEATGGAPLAGLAGPAMRADSWMVVRDLDRWEHGSAPSNEMEFLARAIKHAALGGSMTADEAAGVMVLHPRDGVEADDLAALVKGAVAAMRLQDVPQDVRERLEAVEVEIESGTVVVKGSVTRSVIEDLARRS